MRKWMGAALAAALCLSPAAALADDLTLPSGEVLPLGSEVAVWRGADSYFAEKLDAVLADPALAEAIAQDFIEAGVYGESEKADAERVGQAVADIIRESRMYQLRSVSGNTMYTAYVLSLPLDLPLTEADTARWNRWAREFGEEAGVSGEALARLDRHGELSQSVKAGMEAAKLAARSEGTSAGGVSYQLSMTQLTPEAYDYAMPLWLGVLGTTKADGGNLTVTVILADQASGRYFAPILAKAAEAAK